jgi:hypothetical protein
MFGVLIPANDPEPLGKPCALTDDELGIYIGNGFSVKAHRFPLSVVTIAERPVVVIDRNQDGSVNLSMDIRSEDGKIIARLSKNEFVVNQNNYLSMKRPDRSSLIIVDQYGNEVLRARYLNRRAFRVTGRLNSAGRTVDLSDSYIHNICFDILHGPEGASAIGVP